jgi:DNA-binding CsgD family transcriptional regulator
MSRPAPQRTEMHPDAPAHTVMPPTASQPPPPHDFRAPACTQMHPSAPECTHNSSIGKANPPRALSLRQHAAIRYLARGYPVGKIAAHLGISRHTIKRWKHDAQFIAELERLRQEMTAAIVSPAARAAAPPRPMDPLAAWAQKTARPLNQRPNLDDEDDDNDVSGDEEGEYEDDDDDADEGQEMSDEEAAATEAWIEQVIDAGRTGGQIPPPPPPPPRGSPSRGSP